MHAGKDQRTTTLFCDTEGLSTNNRSCIEGDRVAAGGIESVVRSREKHDRHPADRQISAGGVFDRAAGPIKLGSRNGDRGPVRMLDRRCPYLAIR